jgi:hypothetical protein
MTPRERTAEHWSYIAKQDSKLYEADNFVCVSQPFAVQCFERKPR